MKRLLVVCLVAFAGGFADAEGLLSSWNDGTAKRAIVDFVTQSTREGTQSYVWPNDRIAVFDNDGTLWPEQPIYIQFQFALDRINKLAPQHPEWQTQEPFKSVLAGDNKAFLAGGYKSLIMALAIAHAGLTSDEYRAVIKNWLKTAKHPKTGLLYTQMVYVPMLELLSYLRSNGFRTFIVSGGGTEFMRAFAEETYGIPPDQVIGSSAKVKYEVRNGMPVLVKLPDVAVVNDNEDKVVRIQTAIGRRPIAAFGNSDGDQQMLEWTSYVPGSGTGSRAPRLAMLIHHDDAAREWAYDRKSDIGKLDKALDEAPTKGWIVVSMRNDWRIIFGTKAD